MTDTPLRIITEYLVPPVRVLVTKRLREMGFSQTRIASLMSVSQPAVKQYLDLTGEEMVSRLIDMGLDRDEVLSLVEDLTRSISQGDYEASARLITSHALVYLAQLRFCDFHRRVTEGIPTSCRICSDLFLGDREQVIMEIALSMIRRREVGELIPEVMSNLAYAKEGARDPRDVIAVPGRITKVMGIPTPVSKPAWGGSSHLSKLLIRVLEKNPTIRSVMNIRHVPGIETVLEEMKIPYGLTGPSEGGEEEIIESVAGVVEGGARVVIHRGGIGIEPAVYIFGAEPLDVARVVLKIAERMRLNSTKT